MGAGQRIERAARRVAQRRITTGLALAAAFWMWPFALAVAEQKTLEVANAAWFWESNTQITVIPNDPAVGAAPQVSTGDGVGGGTPQGTGEPISDGHLGVSMRDGASDMRTYVKFDHAALPPGTTFTKYVITMSVSRATQAHVVAHRERGLDAPATAGDDLAVIQACPVTSPFSANAQGDPPYNTTVTRSPDNETDVTTERTELESDCSTKVRGVRSADGNRWTFDVTPIAEKWASGQLSVEGVALLPVPRGPRPTWVVEFHGAFTEYVDTSTGEQVVAVTHAEAAKARAEYTAGLAPPPPPPPPTGGFDDFPSFGNPTGPADPSVPGDGGLAPPPPPQTGGGAPVGRSNPRTPGWLFGLVPLGLIAMGLVSSAIGPAEDAGARADNRVARVLQQRRREGEGAVEAAEVIQSEELAGESVDS